MNVPLPLPNPEAWVGREAAARILGVTAFTIYRMVTTSRLRAYRVDGVSAPLFWRDEVEQVAEARRVAREGTGSPGPTVRA